MQGIALECVEVHPDLQRPISEAHVKRIMEKWNSSAFGVPIVAPQEGRPGWFWCVSGQHRMEAARRLGITHVVCTVMPSSSEEAMARVYMDEQTQREQHPLVKHRIALAAEDTTACGVQDMCDELGYTIPTTSRGGQTSGLLRSVKLLYSLYDRGLLRDTLTIVDAAFDKRVEACHGRILNAIGAFLGYARMCEKNGTATYDQAAFIAALSKAGIVAVTNAYNARRMHGIEVGNNSTIGCAVMVELYNRGRRTRRMPLPGYQAPMSAAA